MTDIKKQFVKFVFRYYGIELTLFSVKEITFIDACTSIFQSGSLKLNRNRKDKFLLAISLLCKTECS